MEVSFRGPFGPLGGLIWAPDVVTGNELGFDRLFAVCKLGQRSHLLSSPAVGGSRRRVETQSIRRAIEAGASHHRGRRVHPPTDLAALTCRVLGALGEA